MIKEEGKKKAARINIRLMQQTLALLKARAATEGLPYQTLAGSVLHRYLMGELVSASDIKNILQSLKED